MRRYLVGTSGWNYDSWKGVFYPEELPRKKWLNYYSQKFPAVEVNATFYREFRDSTYLKWRDTVLEDFYFVLKAPKVITHRYYLKNSSEIIKRFSKATSNLGNKFGLILLQLAPNTPYNIELLAEALLSFAEPKKVAVEFRNEKWETDEVKELLREIGAIYCMVDSPKTRLVPCFTSEIGYIRLHGKKRWYNYDYSDRELEEIAEIAKSGIDYGCKQVFIFFNNDVNAYAPRNANRILEMFGK